IRPARSVPSDSTMPTSAVPSSLASSTSVSVATSPKSSLSAAAPSPRPASASSPPTNRPAFLSLLVGGPLNIRLGSQRDLLVDHDPVAPLRERGMIPCSTVKQTHGGGRPVKRVALLMLAGVVGFGWGCQPASEYAPGERLRPALDKVSSLDCDELPLADV